MLSHIDKRGDQTHFLVFLYPPPHQSQLVCNYKYFAASISLGD